MITTNAGIKSDYLVDTRSRFNIYTTPLTSYKCRINVETTSCVYWVKGNKKYQKEKIKLKLRSSHWKFILVYSMNGKISK